MQTYFKTKISVCNVLHGFFPIVFIFMIIITAATASAALVPEEENLYLTGYIKSLLEEKYNSQDKVAVRSGEVFLADSIASNPQYEAIINDISKIQGVKTIKLVSQSQLERIRKVWLYSQEPLMRPLLADPRWPQFSASANYYSIDKVYKHSFDADFGKGFSIIRMGLGESMFSELGIQAGVFADFDMDKSTFILVNADYFVGLPVTVQWEGFTVMGRVYHQSSHLGDEYMEKHPQIDRVDLQYEVLDFIASFEPNEWFRLYGGGGFIFRRTPSTYGRWLYQMGLEMRVVADSITIPTLVIALDMKGAEETDYVPAWSALMGVEIARNTYIGAQFYDGYSPKGMFYKDKVQSFGIGLHIY